MTRNKIGTSLVVQWLRLRFPIQGWGFHSWSGTCLVAKKQTHKTKQYCNKFSKFLKIKKLVMFLQKCKMLIISSVNSDILGSPPDEGFSWNTARLSQQGSNHVKVYNKYSIGSIFQLHFFVHSFHRVLQSRMGLHNTIIGIIMFCPS